MRDLVDSCPEVAGDCGDDKPMAEARGPDVYVGNNCIMQFDPRSDDYAYTNAIEFAKRWNKHEGRA